MGGSANDRKKAQRSLGNKIGTGIRNAPGNVAGKVATFAKNNSKPQSTSLGNSDTGSISGPQITDN